MMGPNWSTSERALYATERMHELQALGEELHVARQLRRPRRLRRGAGHLLIMAGKALYGPPVEGQAAESGLVVAHKH